MNTNAIHNILNLIGLMFGSLMAYDWAALGLSDSQAATVAGVFILGDKIVKFALNILRDGVSGLFSSQPPVVKKQKGYANTSILFVLLFIGIVSAGCAGGPMTDLDREFIADQFVTRSLDNAKPGDEADRRAELFLKVAEVAESAATPGASTAVINLAVNEALKKYTVDMTLADRKAVEYITRRMLPDTPDINLPLTDEQLRIVGVYARTIKDAVETWQVSQ